jgi:phosphonate transport system permease protein
MSVMSAQTRPVTGNWGLVRGILWTALGLAAVVAMMMDLGLSPKGMAAGFGKLGQFLAAMVPPSDGGDFSRIFAALIETLAMALAGTCLGVLAAIPLGIIGAKNVVRNPVFHFIYRRGLDIFRGVPALVWALIFVAAFGLGPFGGVLALAAADIPSLSKLFAEALENGDPGPVEGTRAAGVSPLLELRFGLAPQMAPIMASQCLYFLESNFRNAAVLGIVGAGGIGFELEERIRVFAFDQLAFIILLYIVAVSLLDTASGWLRRTLR